MAEAEAANDMLLDMPARAENVALCRVAVAAFAGAAPFTLPEVEEIRVVVSEAVSNCVLHAYPPGVEGRVRILARLQGDTLLLEVCDDGRGIEDIARARQAAFTTSTDPEHLGLGFTFMEQFSDRLEVESTPGAGTVVRVHKRPHG